MAAPRLPSLPEVESDRCDEVEDKSTLPLSSPRKRKATEPPSDSSRRPSTRPRRAPPVSKSQLLASASPEPGSINATLREHSRSRLYVRPIAWTMNQPRLLGCQFVPCEPPFESQRVGERTTPPRDQELHQELIDIAKLLQGPGDRSSKKAAVKSLIRAYITSPDLKKFSPAIPFSFGERVVTNVQIDGICSVDPKEAFFAFLHLDTVLDGRRQRYTRLDKRANEPVARIRAEKLRLLQPSNPVEDPYIVAALIALAQSKRWFWTSSDQVTQSADSGEAQTSSKIPALFKARLLVTTEIQSQHLYMYEASFSSAFLDGLEKPSQFSATDPVQVSYYRLPLDNPEELVGRFPCILGLD